MVLVDDSKLRTITGGSNMTIGLFIAAGVAFIISVIDGYVRPLKCN